MKKILKKAFLGTISLANITANKLLDKEIVLSLIHKLRPYDTDKKLIRFGPNGDGGYLIPDDVNDIEACFSPGVGLLSGFEEDCSKNGMKVFLADNSVDSPALQNPQFSFIKKHIGPITNEDFITLDDWVDSSNLGSQNSDLMLQMDIEGYEYSTILSISHNLLNRFRIIVVEFHSLNRLWDTEFFNLASPVFEKLLQNHSCVHIHPNNCCGMFKLKGLEIPNVAEFTFVRNDRIEKKKIQTNIPHPLDFDCEPSFKTLVLPQQWFASNE